MKKIKLTNKRSIIVGIVAFAVVCIGMFLYMLQINTDYTIFADMDECYAMEAALPADAEIEMYENPSADSAIGNLSYEEFFGRKIKCEEFSFKIFAYEFADTQASKQYFKNNVGYDDEGSAGGVMTQNTVACILVVYDRERAYTIHTNMGDFNDVVSFLGKHFSVIISARVFEDFNTQDSAEQTVTQAPTGTEG